MFFLSRIVFCNHSLKIFLHSCDSIGRWRELASYLGPAMLAPISFDWSPDSEPYPLGWRFLAVEVLFKDVSFPSNECEKVLSWFSSSLGLWIDSNRTHPFWIRGMERLDLRERGKANCLDNLSPSGQDWNQFDVPGSRFVRKEVLSLLKQA